MLATQTAQSVIDHGLTLGADFAEIFVEKSQFEQAFQNAWHFVEENWDDIDWSDPQLDVMDYSKLGGLKEALERWNAVEQKFVHTIKGSNQKVGDSSIDGGGNN